MKEYGHYLAPRLDKISGHRVRHPETGKNVPVDAADTKQRKNSAPARGLKAVCAKRDEQGNDIKQAAESENAVGGGGCCGEQVPERTAGGGHRECEVGAALMAARGIRADQGAAGRAELWASLLSAAEKAAHLFTNPTFMYPIESFVKV